MKIKICDRCGKEGKLFWARTNTRQSACLLCAKKEGNAKLSGRAESNIVVRVNTPTSKHTVTELLKLAEIVFNRWIRKRDSYSDGTFKCITCGEWKSIKDMDAGHFYSKTYAATRFDEDNVHSECSYCNRIDPNHMIGYRINLVVKIGEDRVERLRSIHKSSKKWTREELLEIIKKYKS